MEVEALGRRCETRRNMMLDDDMMEHRGWAWEGVRRREQSRNKCLESLSDV